MATHSSILDEETPWREEPGGLQSMHLQKESNKTEQLNNNIKIYIFSSRVVATIFLIFIPKSGKVPDIYSKDLVLTYFYHRKRYTTLIYILSIIKCMVL